MSMTVLTDPLEAMERLGRFARYRQGEPLYHQDDPACYWYRIVTGAARKYAMMSDGRRQIVDFLFPGDVFGFDSTDDYHFSVEVIVEGTLVARYPRQSLEMLAESNPYVGKWIREAAFRAIARLHRRVVLLGRTTALWKVSAFLLEMADRSGADAGNAVALPMSRYDIADYLAIAVETVSRALTQLRERGAITLRGARMVRIVDRDALESVAEINASSNSPVARTDSPSLPL